MRRRRKHRTRHTIGEPPGTAGSGHIRPRPAGRNRTGTRGHDACSGIAPGRPAHRHTGTGPCCHASTCRHCGPHRRTGRRCCTRSRCRPRRRTGACRQTGACRHAGSRGHTGARRHTTSCRQADSRRHAGSSRYADTGRPPACRDEPGPRAQTESGGDAVTRATRQPRHRRHHAARQTCYGWRHAAGAGHGTRCIAHPCPDDGYSTRCHAGSREAGQQWQQRRRQPERTPRAA